MIRVAKPEQAPRILRERGQRTRDENEAAYEAGTRSFKFDGSLYGAKSVKNALIKAQHGKCAFCEANFTHIAYGDVEHLRPKGGFRQAADEPLEQPGYFWLAFAWENLFASCTLCNQRFKGNLFPLADPMQRARSHLHDLGREEPLLIDPARDDPSNFIAFREEVAFAIDDHRRGHATIDALGLNREELVEHRLDRLAMCKLLHDALGGLPPESLVARDIEAFLDGRKLPRAEYSSMIRCFLEAAG